MASIGLQKKKQREELLRQRLKQRNEETKRKLDDWFERFDTDHSGRFEHAELHALLTHLHPEFPPTTEIVNMLIEKATTIKMSNAVIKGSKDGQVPRDKLIATVKMYSDYSREQLKIDAIFDKYDTDRSGSLEESELLPLLLEFGQGIPADAADVAFIMEHCDMDNDKSISRDELLPLLGTWKQIAKERFQEIKISNEAASKETKKGLADLVLTQVTQIVKPSGANTGASTATAEPQQTAGMPGSSKADARGLKKANSAGSLKNMQSKGSTCSTTSISSKSSSSGICVLL